MRHSDARRRAFSEVPETCGNVQAALDRAFETIKEKATEPLRSALIGAFEQIEELEGELEDKEKRIAELEGEVDDLKDTIASYEKSEATAANGGST